MGENTRLDYENVTVLAWCVMSILVAALGTVEVGGRQDLGSFRGRMKGSELWCYVTLDVECSGRRSGDVVGYISCFFEL